MANKTTGQLNEVAPLGGDELVHVEQDGNSRKTTLDEIAEYCIDAASETIFNPIQASGTGTPQNITLPYTGLLPQDVSVFVNGIRYEIDEYAISSNQLTITTNASGDSIEILSRGNSNTVEWSMRPPVKNISSSSYNLLAADEGKYLRYTNSGTKTITVRNNATEAMPIDGEWIIRNVGTGDLTMVEDTQVTINPSYGGSLVIQQGKTVTLKRVAINEYDVIG